MARNTSGSHTSATDARARARQIQEQQRKKDGRRRTAVIWGSVLAAILVIGLIVAFALNRGGDEPTAAGPIPAAANEQGGIELTSATTLAEGAGAREVDASTVEVPEQGDAQQPETIPAAEAPAEGEPSEIVLYADFNCVHCADFETSNAAQIEQWLEAGEVTVEYRMVDFLSAPNNQNYSARAANAAYCVADQKPEAYNGFVTALFGTYHEHGGKGIDNAALTQLAQDNGADIASCVEDGTFRSAVEHTTRQAQAAGVGGTPTVFMDGENWAYGGPDQSFQEWAQSKISG